MYSLWLIYLCHVYLKYHEVIYVAGYTFDNKKIFGITCLVALFNGSISAY